MVVICLGPVCVPILPVVALALKPIWDYIVPDNVKHILLTNLTRAQNFFCPKRASANQEMKDVPVVDEQHPVIHIENEAHFHKLLAESDEYPLIMKATADWCGPCKVIKPVFLELAEEHTVKNGLRFCEIDVDECDSLALSLGVSSIPAFHAYLSGDKIDDFSGAKKNELVQLINRVLTARKDLSPSHRKRI